MVNHSVSEKFFLTLTKGYSDAPVQQSWVKLTKVMHCAVLFFNMRGLRMERLPIMVTSHHHMADYFL